MREGKRRKNAIGPRQTHRLRDSGSLRGTHGAFGRRRGGSPHFHSEHRRRHPFSRRARPLHPRIAPAFGCTQSRPIPSRGSRPWVVATTEALRPECRRHPPIFRFRVRNPATSLDSGELVVSGIPTHRGLRTPVRALGLQTTLGLFSHLLRKAADRGTVDPTRSDGSNARVRLRRAGLRRTERGAPSDRVRHVSEHARSPPLISVVALSPNAQA